MSTFYIDLENGNDSNAGTSWALAWKTITSGATAARIAPGDVIRISKTINPISIGNATWTNNSATITLATAQNATIDRCEIAWTAANSGVVTRNAMATDGKEGSYSMQIAAPASPTTSTLYAYYATGTLDLSAYQTISFWVKNSAVVSAGNWKICLCSDTAGTTIVDTFEITAIASSSLWLPLTIARTGGGNLGSAIKSIALYSSTVAPTGSSYLRLDNIIACTTNGLSLQSLISKNGNAQGGTEGFFAIQSIVGTTVLLDGYNTTKPTDTWQKYGGTTETVTTYIRSGFKTTLATSTTANINLINDNGTAAGGYIEFSGGWNTSTDLQDGETFFDGLNCYGVGINFNSKEFVKINHLHFNRYYYGISAYQYSYIDNVSSNNMSSYSIYVGNGNYNYVGTIISSCFNPYCLYINGYNSIINTVYQIFGINSYGIYVNGYSNLIRNVVLSHSKSNTILNIASGSNNKFKINTSGSGTPISILNGITYLFDSLISQSTEYTVNSLPGDIKLISLNHDNTVGNHWIFEYQATVNMQTATVHGTEPVAWKTAITGSTRTIYYPVKLKVVEIAVGANTQAAISAYVKKDHATNIGSRLVIYANSTLGISETAATKASDINWEQLTLNVTPTAAGVIEVYLETWYVAGNSNSYIGTVTATQS